MRFVVYEQTRLGLAYDSLDGLSVGDALGAQFFMVGPSLADLVAGRPPAGPWEWTDDTHMACSVAEQLRDHGGIDQDRLAATFAERCEPYRGYGAGAVVILHEIRDGLPWRQAAAAAFAGQGSCGNGAAMRVAPLGAYHLDRPNVAAEQAIRSAEVTHAHPEGIAGAVLVAVAAAHAAAARLGGARPSAAVFLDQLRPYQVEGAVQRGMARAARLIGRSVEEAAYELGNGSRVTAQDTVPFALWTAAAYLDNYPAAITACVKAGTRALYGSSVKVFFGLIGDHSPFPSIERSALDRAVFAAQAHWAVLRVRGRGEAKGHRGSGVDRPRCAGLDRSPRGRRLDGGTIAGRCDRPQRGAAGGGGRCRGWRG